MTVRELIRALSVLPPNYQVMAAGESAEKVVVEKCDGNEYVRIFQPWDIDLVCPAKELAEKEQKNEC